MERYSVISDGVLPRESILLVGTGCKWAKCAYCDYHKDTVDNPFEINKSVIDKLTGELGTVQVLNSGSIFELDGCTMEYLITKLNSLPIQTVWTESHWVWRKNHDVFRERVPNITVKFCLGLETFNYDLRKAWKKGIPDVAVTAIQKHYNGVCLLVGVEGQGIRDVHESIKYAGMMFDYVAVNVFVENSTNVKRNDKLCDEFMKHVYPTIKDKEPYEIFLHNTDIGLG